MTSKSETRLHLSCKCRKRAPETRPSSEKIRDRCQKFILSEDTLKNISNLFTEEVKKGLSRKTHDTASVKCYLTYVQETRPSGNEKGKFAAIDFASATLRLVLCEIIDEVPTFKTKYCQIPEYTLFSTGAQLFDNIVEHLAKFLREEKISRDKIFLAVTVGFPLMQKGLQKGFLLKWTKGFKCSNVVGNDIVVLLQDAIERKGDIDVEVCAVLNDTTGTLISCAYDHHSCKIGAIICTGTNACYAEKQKNAELFDEEDSGSGVVLINTEWGGFGDDGVLNFIKTEFDKDVDESSTNLGKEVFEKMVAGLYMGELVRLVIVQLTRDGYLFGGKGSAELYTSEVFQTSDICNIENELPGDFGKCISVLRRIGIASPTNEDCTNVRFVCECISRRSAQMIAATLAALINKINEPIITIGIDGSVYNDHPHYHNVIVTTLEKLVKHGIKYEVVATCDGGGRGATLLAAAVSKTIKTYEY